MKTAEVGDVVKLVKRGDTYRPAKLAASVRGAGASAATAAKVLKMVKVRNGMSTLQLRKQVTAILKKIDPKAEKHYNRKKKR